MDKELEGHAGCGRYLLGIRSDHGLSLGYLSDEHLCGEDKGGDRGSVLDRVDGDLEG